ncbi:hypothetical protein [Sphingomonas colocasiae]|uniref:Uncharacterized protein n=1 Tax=Sphingomonas colocasiae TaxID=1848973 RepID=A0ABS7PWY5_9SPHN|nr:hypothetical protein [Sphingomonas colocasiae]MBY8824489.1 hypothetical protein [Sphingomonas colocasiae]
MAKITSITLSYVQAEDRIHFASLLDDARTVRMWLTQRLARLLVRALANHMEKAEGIPLPTVRDAMMAQEQAQAVSNIKPSRPVVTDPDVPVHLVTNITLKLSAEKIGLFFESDLDFQPSIVLDRTLVRQWLSMLHRQFETASWPLDVWPEWMIEGNAAPASSATRH